MAKVSFTGNEAQQVEIPVEDDATPASQTAIVVPRENTAVAEYSEGGVAGEIGRSDLNMPRLSLVQSVGPMSELFKPGQLVLNKETVLTDGDKPVTVIVINIKKAYKENLKYEEDGPMPRVLNTLAEVKAEGGTVEYAGDEPPSWIPYANTLILVESTEDNPAFPFEHNGKFYAAALWTLQKTSYTRAAKAIFTAAEYALRGKPLCAGRWSLGTKREKLGQNFVYVPVFRMTGKNDDAFVAWVKEMGL